MFQTVVYNLQNIIDNIQCLTLYIISSMENPSCTTGICIMRFNVCFYNCKWQIHLCHNVYLFNGYKKF